MAGPVIAIAALLTGAGCRPASRHLDADSLARSRPKRLLLVLKEETLLGPRGPAPPAPGMAGALGADIAMSLEGEKIMKKHGIADPSFAIGRYIARGLAERHALTLSEFRETPPPNAESAYLPRPPWPDTDLALQVHTTTWAIQNTSPDAQPVVRYAAEARLTDMRSRRILARGECVGDDGDAAAPVTARYYELFFGSPILLQGELDRLSQVCIRRFAGDLFALPMSPPG